MADGVESLGRTNGWRMIGWGLGAPPGSAATFVLIEFFAALWLASAWLFHLTALGGR